MDKTGKIPRSTKSKGWGIIGATYNRLVNCIARYIPMYPESRVKLQRIRGVNVGKEVFIGSDVLFDEVFPEDIVIEDEVTIIARSTILSHAFYPTHFKNVLKDKKNSKTILKKGCYIGLGSIILPGITIGEYSVIAAGSVVTKNVEPYTMVAGVPAIKIKEFKLDFNKV